MSIQRLIKVMGYSQCVLAVVLTGCGHDGTAERPQDAQIAVAAGALTGVTQDFELALPVATTIDQVGLGSSRTITIENGVVLTSSGSAKLTMNSTNSATLVGNDARLFGLTTLGTIGLGSRTNVNGNVKSARTVSRDPSVVVSGTVQQNLTLTPLTYLRWRVTFPSVNGGPVSVANDATRTLAPGDYGALTAYSRSTLRLSPGSYTFTSVQLEPDARLLLDDAAGAVYIYVKDQVTYRGRVATVSGGAPKLLVGYAGQLDTTLDAAFSGTFVAPRAKVILSTNPHKGSFFAKDLLVRANANVQLVGFPAWSQAVGVDFDGDGVADSVDNCPTQANANQADADSDGLGDVCDQCPSGADQDKDGVCDASDNCPSAANPDQGDVDGNGVGDRCDAQRCYSPLTPGDRQRALALAFAHPTVAPIFQRRYRVTEERPLCIERGAAAPRRVRMGIYDYGRNLTVDVVANLDSAQLDRVSEQTRQPPIIASERQEIRTIAEASPAVLAALGSDVPNHAFDSFGVNSGSAAICRTHRCGTVVYAKTEGGSGSFVPNETYNGGIVHWSSIQNIIEVTVDLSAGQVVNIDNLR